MDALVSTDLSTDPGSGSLFVALELSRATWLVALHSPIVNKVSQHRLNGGDVDGLLGLITRKREQAAARLGRSVRSCAASLDEWREHQQVILGNIARFDPPARSSAYLHKFPYAKGSALIM